MRPSRPSSSSTTRWAFPLYVVYPKGGGDGRKLSTVLTYDSVEKALEAAAHP